MKLVNEIVEALEMLSIDEKKAFYPRFFKTGKGEYGEGDLFIGVTVPDQRSVSKAYWNKVSFNEIEELLKSKYHEHRATALFILVLKFEKSKSLDEKKSIVDFYLNNKQYINNWDLVDASCYKILGQYCLETDNDSILKNLASEEEMWSKRMGIVGTMSHVKKGRFQLTLELALQNLYHQHDLMHKANGWLLREVGNKNEEVLLAFLKLHYHKMPRTTLRYAIEKLDEDVRQSFLKGFL